MQLFLPKNKSQPLPLARFCLTVYTHHPSAIYKAIAIRPARAAARPTSSFPAAPVDSATPPVDVPVAPITPLGLGAEPLAVARVELSPEETLIEPVPEAEAEAPVPLGLMLPEVEVGTLVAVCMSAIVLCNAVQTFGGLQNGCTYKL